MENSVLGRIRKIGIGCMVLLCMMRLGACASPQAPDVNGQDYFDARLLEIGEDYLIVEPIHNEEVNAAVQVLEAPLVLVNKEVMAASGLPEMCVGDGLRIVYNGTSVDLVIYAEGTPQETEAVQLGIVFAVYVQSQSSGGAGDVLDEPVDEKPVIYLYPEKEQPVSVTLRFGGELTVLYPQGELQRDVVTDDGRQDIVMEDGRWDVVSWHVMAAPDGTLTDLQDGREYSYLFWEGIADEPEYDFSSGYCVAGSETAEFLQDILAQMGLTAKEYNEFIVYWLPRMQGNPYNIISFQQETYTDHAQLKITPQPDSVLRVFMAVKPSPVYVEMEPQSFAPFDRRGFTVVEWGGSMVQ